MAFTVLCEYLNDVTASADLDAVVIPCNIDSANDVTLTKNAGTITGANHPTVTGTGIDFDPKDSTQIGKSGTGQLVTAALDGLDIWSAVIVTDLRDSQGVGGDPFLTASALGIGLEVDVNDGPQFALGSRAGNGRWYITVNKADADGQPQFHQRWSGSFNSASVYVINVDMTQSVATDRIELFRDNVLLGATSQSPNNAAPFRDVANLKICMGGLVNDTAARGYEGLVFYGAFLSGNLNGTERSDVQSALDTNVNVSPFGAPPVSLTAPGIFNF